MTARSRAGPIWPQASRPATSPKAACWSAMSATTRCCWCAQGGTVVGHRRALHALPRTARRRARRRQHHPLSLASRLFRLANRRGAGGARAQSPRLLAGRGARRPDCCRRQERAGAAEADRISIRADRHRRRRRAPALPRPRCCGGAAMPAASRCCRNDDAAPVDRPNLSKDYLAGSAPEDWVPLRGDDWYAREPHHAQAEDRGDRARSARQRAHARRRQHGLPSTSCCWRPAPSR